jgi:hypothetical protein
MKSAIFAVALLMSGAALAQDDATTDAIVADTVMVPATAQIVLPSNADPERDARGIAVISSPAIVPPGFNLAPGTSVPAVGGPLIDAETGAEVAADAYPACTASVTDNCLQTYERHRDAN